MPDAAGRAGSAVQDFTPVHILTGFLGSGKTTLLGRLLRDPALADTAVLINEFGEIGLDHHLVERIDETVVLLSSGCLCCTVRGELSDAIKRLLSQRERGLIPAFRRLVIETTGLADPSPVLTTLAADPVLKHHVRLGTVLATVDAVNGVSQLARHPESVKQVAVADRLVLTKTDLASAAATQATVAALRRLNPDAALLGSVFIQVGTNLSNDYSDARRGADAEDRLGPVRVTAGGLVPPRQVLIATYVSFGLAVVAGIYLIVVAGWQLLIVGAASILAGVGYTGGPRPYGYEGLGELFVFLFFGIVAVAGSFFVQMRHLNWEAFALAVPVGLLAAAILVVNNVRDIDSDRRAGKRTLAVKLGRERTRGMFAAGVYLAYLLAPVTWVFGPTTAWVLLPWLTLPLAAGVVRVVRNRTDGQSLNGALAQSGMLQLAFCVLLSVGLLLSR